ncbi:MAG: DUF554 domain-containing protein [Parabacteroides sp.]|nr:DUF554 domain-containing protein [Parabacteroides sp.]MBQ8531596.1 DUF554 domain-containing protein [Parabacteroides sp.]
MLGTLVNTLTIIVGSTFGHFVKKGIKKEYQKVMFTAMGLASLALGFNAVSNHLPKSQYPVLFIISLSIGGLIGTVIDIDGRFKRLVSRFSSSNSNLAQGLSTGILLYCIGTLSIVGPMLSALYNDNTYLFTNATLDLVTSAVLAATYGIGMILAAPVLFCWQGSIYLLTSLVGNVIPDALMTEVSIVGGILIAASGLGILEIKDCKTLNLLPSLAIPVFFFIAKYFIFGV